MPLSAFHPATRRWFESSFEHPSAPQQRGWPSIKGGQHTLIAAPTGSGKTLAAFLSAIDDLVQDGLRAPLPAETRVLYVSPLKALSNDIERNLQAPLEGIGKALAELGLPDVPIRTMVRTGDTPAAERARFTKQPPHILVTTPESLYILLTSEGGRRALATVQTVIVDEIHAMLGDKRGCHLALSIERLQALVQGPLTRIGLSATQNPIENVARFLIGTEADAAPETHCNIVDCGHRRQMNLRIELPPSPLEAVMSGEVWDEIFDRLAALVGGHDTTLIFVNTRRLAERVCRHLGERLGEDRVAAHHGSMSRKHRHVAEQRLKAGDLSALVATASLELGIDIGSVDLVCQLGSTRSIAALLQRVGRSGHFHGGIPDGRVFPLSRDDLVECTALVDAVNARELDVIAIPEAPLDILAQQIVATVSAEEWDEAELFHRMTRAYPYRNLTRAQFDAVVRMVADGFSTQRGRRGALLHHDRVNGKLRARKAARLTAITSGGAIPDNADYKVVLEPAGHPVGSLNEDFAIESMIGDVFQLGNASYRILRVETGVVRVEDAQGIPPSIPFWLGEAPARTRELSERVSSLRGQIDGLLSDDVSEPSMERARQWITERGFEPEAAQQMIEYLGAAKAALGTLPTQQTVVVERFFDESGGMQLVLHSPFGGRINRAWGLSLRKRFCRSFNFELQAAATEDAIVLSLGPTHSFPLETIQKFLSTRSIREVLVQALLAAPMFETRWRWNASRSLAVPRFRGGKKVPPFLLRMLANDLLSVAFPDQQACLENIEGDREIPDHPLVQQTVNDCLTEAMDLEGFTALLSSLERGETRMVFRELNEPSPLAHEILNARPYAFLDDAPLEERRTQAVMSRRFLDPDDARQLGALDQGAIDRVRDEAWPRFGDGDELHDALSTMGFLTEDELARAPETSTFLQTLCEARRSSLLQFDGRKLAVCAERLLEMQAIHPDATLQPPMAPADPDAQTPSRDVALVEVVRGRLESMGPVTPRQIADSLGCEVDDVDGALGTLESQGFVMRGEFTPGRNETEWCERRLLARIHRYTINRLRREIEPVTAQQFMRFLIRWQHLAPQDEQLQGPDGLERAIAQLQGFSAQAASWELDLLAARVDGYDPAWLDQLCLSGRVTWARLATSGSTGGGGPLKTTPITVLVREGSECWRAAQQDGETQEPSSAGRAVRDALREGGALFFGDLRARTGLLPSQLETALGELVARGEVRSDGFAGLRLLLTPTERRPRPSRNRKQVDDGRALDAAGRWSLVTDPAPATDAEQQRSDALERIAKNLLARYGVVFRRMLEREDVPPWRDLLRVYRRLEARGEIRGGRFVDGFTGEQFADPEAIKRLRAVRRDRQEGQLVTVGATDPLNLLGTLLPGERVASIAKNRILFRDGIPVAVLEKGEVRFLTNVPEEARWDANLALQRRRIPAPLRGYLTPR